MRINPHLFRKLMIYIEDTVSTDKLITSEDIASYLPNFTEEEIYYHVRYLDDDFYFRKVDYFMGLGFMIYDLSPKGHQFAETMRSDTVWNKTIETSKKIGSATLDTIYKIGIDVVASLISKSLGA